ncbi:MAG: S-layer homology domain-containing protein [Micrococcus sp.]|nr:S-layer homology domain-containing protein [Micrococcus sp.]
MTDLRLTALHRTPRLSATLSAVAFVAALGGAHTPLASAAPEQPAAIPAVTQTSSVPAASVSDQAQMLRLVNEYRAQHGKAPVRMAHRLNTSAAECAGAISRFGTLAHCTNGQVGGYSGQYYDRFPQGWRMVAENVARASTVRVTFDLWVASEGHRKNILSDATHFGYAQAPSPVAGQQFHVQHFAAYPPSFRMPGGLFFTDVAPTHWAYSAITWISERGITTGYRDNSFRPNNHVTRGEVAAFLYRYSGDNHTGPSQSPFWDMRPQDPHYDAVTWAVDQGIFTGYVDGSARAASPVSRQEIAIMMHRMAGSPAASGAHRFRDVSATSYAAAAVQWLAGEGIARGYTDGTFRPTIGVARSETAAMMQRYAQR